MDSVDAGQRSEYERHQAGQSGAGKAPRGPTQRRLLAVGGLLIIFVVSVWATRRLWLPYVPAALTSLVPRAMAPRDADKTANPDSGHAHDGEPDVANAVVSSLELSAQGRKNIGLILETIALKEYERTIAIPATLVEREGQTQILVSAPMTGIVTKIFPIRGEAVTPGMPLFDLRMTHEDLVEKQSSLLRLLEELEVVTREAVRLQEVTASGAVAGKRLLEQEYEQHKIEASIRAERQALLLHGLSHEQIQGIVDNRLLVQRLMIVAPDLDDHAAADEHEEFLQVTKLPVSVGEHVQMGDPLATLTDHCMLYIEGRAFEQDAEILNRVANEGIYVSALIDSNGSQVHRVPGLQILQVENEVERESRALNFYVLLPNQLIRNRLNASGKRFIGWRYKPGQRVEVLIPVDRWERRIVLPVEAVIAEGAERYVFQEVEGRFNRVSVHVEYRDQRFAVIENDGTLFPGDKVAAKGAYQIHLALKNKAGGGPDPHAGHHH